MQLIVVYGPGDLSHLAADLIGQAINEDPATSLLAATGNTPMGTYRELVQRYAAGSIHPSGVRIFQLDEYLGVGVDDRRSLYGWMRRSLLDPLNIGEDRVVSLVATASDVSSVCREYDRGVAAGRAICLSVVGLGPNGHLGFNEPPADPSSPTRVVELSDDSIISNASYWGGPAHVPRRAVTAGMHVILGARRTLLLVSGEHKRGILRRMLDQPNNPLVPASYLFTARNVTILADRDAWPWKIPAGLK